MRWRQRLIAGSVICAAEQAPKQLADKTHPPDLPAGAGEATAYSREDLKINIADASAVANASSYVFRLNGIQALLQSRKLSDMRTATEQNGVTDLNQLTFHMHPKASPGLRCI